MNIKLNGSESGLIAYWPMDEGQGQVTTDFSGSIDGRLGSSSTDDISDPRWVKTKFPYEN